MEHVVVPETPGVVQQSLVEQREVGRAHDRTTAGNADCSHAWVVEPLHVVRRGRSDVYQCRDVALLLFGDPQKAREAERLGDAVLDEVAEVDAAEPLDEVDQHPVRRRRVVCESRARLPLELPLRELLAAPRRVATDEREHLRLGEARGVQHDVLDRDRREVVAIELGEVRPDRALHVEPTLADQHPHCRRDDRLGAREDAVAGRGRRGAEGLECDELAVARDRELTRRQPATLHVGGGGIEQLRDRAHSAAD